MTLPPPSRVRASPSSPPLPPRSTTSEPPKPSEPSEPSEIPEPSKPPEPPEPFRVISCVARQRLLIPSILSILSRSTPHPQPPHLYKCGGSHAANNEGHWGGLCFAAIEACAVKASDARSRQPFFPASSVAASHGRNADIGQTMTPSLRLYA